MNIADVVIVLLILLSGVVGFKRGFFKQTVMTVGTVLVFVLAFLLKNPLADWFCLHLPFWNFKGVFSTVTVLNVVLYQCLAFLLILVILLAVLNIVIRITGVFEKILKFTIILGIPSKILGAIVGLIEGYVIVFVVVFFLNQPSVNLPIITESKLIPGILDHTPILSGTVKNMRQTFVDIYELKDGFGTNTDTNKFNLEVLDVMLKHGIVEPESIDQLSKKGKLNFPGVDAVTQKYKK